MGTPYSRQAARTKDGATSGSVGGRRLILALEVFNNAEVEIFLRPEACSNINIKFKLIFETIKPWVSN
jgi:hypothetical protein